VWPRLRTAASECCADYRKVCERENLEYPKLSTSKANCLWKAFHVLGTYLILVRNTYNNTARWEMCYPPYFIEETLRLRMMSPSVQGARI
jgi:hypothetical protein